MNLFDDLFSIKKHHVLFICRVYRIILNNEFNIIEKLRFCKMPNHFKYIVGVPLFGYESIKNRTSPVKAVLRSNFKPDKGYAVKVSNILILFLPTIKLK